MALRVRLSDQTSWASEPWAPRNAAELRAGIVAARREWVRSRVACAGEQSVEASCDPAWAFAARRQQVEAWLAERLARPGSERNHAGWRAQAQHWIVSARQEYERPLQLQVEWPSGDGRWSAAIAATGYPYRAIETTPDAAACAELLGGCRREFDHVQSLFGLASWVGDKT